MQPPQPPARDPQDRPTPASTAAAFILAMLPATAMGLRMNPDLGGGGLLNPDSAMRLVRLHDIIAAGWPVHAVMRDGSGAGTMLHWSHLLDSLLLLLAAPLAALLGWDAALHAAGVAMGPLGLGAVGVAVAWIATPIAGRGWAWLGAFAAGATPVLGGYGMPGVVHHHVLLALAAIMAAGWAVRLLRGAPPLPGGIALGAWGGAGLWLSPESLPFTLMAMGALWAAWFAAPHRRLATALLAAAAAFLLVTAAAWAVDPPAPGWAAVEPDRISLPFVLLALGAAATAALARRTGGRIGPVAFGAAAAIVWLLAFPQMLRGTEGLMPREAARAFFDGIVEMQPVQGTEDVLETLLGGLFATSTLLLLAWRRRDPVLFYAALCGAVLLALTVAHVRFAPYPAAAGAIMLPIVLSWITRSAMAPALQSAARLALVLPLLLAPVLAPLAAPAPAHAHAARATTHLPCRIDGAATLLAPHPGAIVLAGVNETPDLLYRAPIRTVGSLYHRNPDAFMRLRAAWRATPHDTPGPELRDTGATLLLACPGEARSSIVEDLPHDTLLDRVNAGQPPAWLHPVGTAGGFVLYQVAQ